MPVWSGPQTKQRWLPFLNVCNVSLLADLQNSTPTMITLQWTCHVPYSEQLRKLKIYSLEIRRERYMILFLYKILIGTYPNPGLDLSSIHQNTRTGIKVTPKINLRARVQTIRRASFINKAPQLFNILPLKLRQPKYINNPTPKYVDKFKKRCWPLPWNHPWHS